MREPGWNEHLWLCCLLWSPCSGPWGSQVWPSGAVRASTEKASYRKLPLGWYGSPRETSSLSSKPYGSWTQNGAMHSQHPPTGSFNPVLHYSMTPLGLGKNHIHPLWTRIAPFEDVFKEAFRRPFPRSRTKA